LPRLEDFGRGNGVAVAFRPTPVLPGLPRRDRALAARLPPLVPSRGGTAQTPGGSRPAARKGPARPRV